MKFYICEECKGIFSYFSKADEAAVCCDDNVKEIVAHTQDVGNEKHLPVVEVNGNLVHVKVGSVEHPMLDNHFINWIVLETEQGVQTKQLNPDSKPEATFALVDGDKPIAAYEYCNLHGLWKTNI